MADLIELKNGVRIGTVHSIDDEKKTARVKFEDKGGMISGGLHVLKRKDDWMPEVGQMVFCIMIPDGEGDGFVIGGI
jgi:phage baseplate assembly protein gpV